MHWFTSDPGLHRDTNDAQPAIEGMSLHPVARRLNSEQKRSLDDDKDDELHVVQRLHVGMPGIEVHSELRSVMIKVEG